MRPSSLWRRRSSHCNQTSCWARLNEAVGGNLIAAPAPFGACATDPKGAPCVDAVANIQNPFYLGDQPGGTQVSGWLDAWTPAPSAYAVKARSSGDVAAAVNFARDNNLRLVVKGAGHSYQGTSNAPDSLLIWTRAMNGCGANVGGRADQGLGGQRRSRGEHRIPNLGCGFVFDAKLAEIELTLPDPMDEFDAGNRCCGSPKMLEAEHRTES
jgi:hypothetical protein